MTSSEFKEHFADLLARANRRDLTVIADLEHAIEDPAHAAPTRCQLRCLRAFTLARAGETAEAEKSINALLPFVRRERLYAIVAQCHRILAECSVARGDQLAQRQHYADALAAAQQCNDSALLCASEIHVANLIGEWGRPARAALVLENLLEKTDWADPALEAFLPSTLGMLSWWLSLSGQPEEALRHLDNPAASTPVTPYRTQSVATNTMLARHVLGERLDLNELETLLTTALEQGWHGSASELHWLISHQAPTDSMLAKTSVMLALGVMKQGEAGFRQRVVERALECATARGDAEGVAEFSRMQREQRAAIAHADEVAPLVCPVSGEVLRG